MKEPAIKESRKTILNNGWIKAFLLYTALFCVFVVGIFSVLLIEHRSFMQFHDAYKQGAYHLIEIRNQLRNIISGEGFSYWSWYEGMGLDEPLENFIDPFAIIGSMFPIRYLELGFTFAALLRMYFGGIAFLLYSREVGTAKRKAVLASVLYVFSACFIGLALRQSELLINAYLFPLLVASTERIYKGKSPVPFILVVAYYSMSSIYLAYMSGLVIVMYIAIRYFAYEKEGTKAAGYIRNLLSFMAYGIIGLMISGVATIFSYYTLKRASTGATSGMYGALFDADWYLTFGKMLMGTGATYDYSDVGIPMLSILLIPVAVRRCSKKSTNTIMFIILFIMMLIPFFSSMFNGFGYVTFRWSYTLLFFAVCCGIEQLDIRIIREKTNIVLAAVSLAVMTVWTFVLYKTEVIDISRTGSVYVPLQLAAGLAMLAVLIICGRKGRIGKTAYALLLIIPLVSLSAGWSRGFTNNIEEFAHNSSVYNNLQKSALRAGKDIEDKGFYRIDSIDGISRHGNLKHPSNENIWWQTNNLFIYNSRLPQRLIDFNVAMGNSYGYARRVYIISNGNRPGLDFISGVRYFLGNDSKNTEHNDSDNYADYGFERSGETDGVTVLKNKYDVDMGFVLGRVMSESDYDKLGRAEKEQALLQAVVVPDEHLGKCEGLSIADASDLEFDVKRLPFEVADADGITYEDGRVKAEKGGASFVIKLKDVPESQLLVSFDNLLRNSEDGRDSASFEVYAETDRVKKLAINQKSRQGVEGLKDYDLSMGVCKGDMGIRISFSAKGNYTFDDLYVSAMGLENYDKFASECVRNGFITEKYSGKLVEGSVNAEKDGILFLSIPAYENWDIYIDGDKADTIRDLDKAFVGARISKGQHSVTLKYNNRYVKYGAMLSLAGIIAMAVAVLINKRNTQQNNSKKKRN